MASELKIGTTVELFTGNKENPLSRTNVSFNSTGSVQTKVLEEKASVFVEGGVGGEDGCLLVKIKTLSLRRKWAKRYRRRVKVDPSGVAGKISKTLNNS
jgi:hypothetical protein